MPVKALKLVAKLLLKMGGICSKGKTRNCQPGSSTEPDKNSKPLADEAHSPTNEPGGVTNGYSEPLQTISAEVIQPEIQTELYTSEERCKQRSVEEYKRTFTAYYARLCDALCAPIVRMLPDLVSSGVITVHETEEILSEKTSIEKAQALLNKHIFRGISAGCPEVLENLLSVMRHCSDHTCKALSKEICLKLNISPAKNASCECVAMHVMQ